MEVVCYVENLPAEVYKFAEQSLGETREIRQKSLAELIKWLDENPSINAPRDSTFLLHFLRGSKFRIEHAKKRIET